MNHKPTVVIADDDEKFLMYAAILLDRMDFDVLPAKTGSELIETVKVMCPDVVILDVDLPGMDGLTTLKTLKASADIPQVPVILVSQTANIAIYEECREYGPCSYLMKPLLVEELHATLQVCQFRQTGGRKKLRAPFTENVLVHVNGQSMECHGVNLSEGGVYLRRSNPLPVGTRVEVVLPLLVGEPLSLAGKVIYTRGVEPGKFRIPPGMAIKFEGVGPDEAARLLLRWSFSAGAAAVMSHFRLFFLLDQLPHHAQALAEVLPAESVR